MKVYRLQEIKHRVVHYTECDLCKDQCNGTNWGRSNSHEITTKIELEDITTSYPDGGYGERVTIDMCPDCFRKKFLVWFKEQGGCIKRGEIDF